MVYDEGFEFNLGEKDTKEFSSYFSFLRYSKNDRTISGVKSKYYSHCYQTLIGWYHTDNGKWGCFYGNKKVQNFDKPTNGEASDKLIVLQNTVKREEAFIEVKKNEQKNFIFDSYLQERFLQSENRSKLQNTNNLKTNTATRTYLKLTNDFTNHSEVVERINSLNLGWKANLYDEFKGKTISQLNKISGRKSKGGHYTRYYMENKNNEFMHKENFRKRYDKIDLSIIIEFIKILFF